MTLSDLLDAGNGVWAVLALWLSAFMIFHVLAIRAQRKIRWSRLLFNFSLPLSVQLALGTLAVAGAVFLVRMPHRGVYAAGTALGVIGFLCVLRTVSQPTFGQWPWMAALASSAAYLAWWVAKFF